MSTSTEKLEITTLCGNGRSECIDGIGLSAAFHQCWNLCLVPSSDSGDDVLLIAEIGSCCIRRLKTSNRKEIEPPVTQSLMASSLPVPPLIALILEYTIVESV